MDFILRRQRLKAEARIADLGGPEDSRWEWIFQLAGETPGVPFSASKTGTLAKKKCKTMRFLALFQEISVCFGTSSAILPRVSLTHKSTFTLTWAPLGVKHKKCARGTRPPAPGGTTVLRHRRNDAERQIWLAASQSNNMCLPSPLGDSFWGDQTIRSGRSFLTQRQI